MNRKYAISLAVLAVCLVAASSAYAFGGWQGSEEAKTALENEDYQAFVDAIAPQITEQQFHQMVEENQAREAVELALENGDYDAWVQALDSMPKITDIITEENFAEYAAMHEAMQNGDMETAREISEQLGLNQFQHMFRGGPHAGMGGMGKGMAPCNQWQEGIAEGS